ncbi:MAG: tyrosine-type recombinase/integrase [Gaiellaceae bacterium]
MKYVHGVRTFLEWGGAKLEDATPLDIDLFLSAWESGWEAERGARPRRSTVRARIAALRSFFSYLERAGLLTDGTGRPAKNPMLGVVAPALEQRPNDFLQPIEDAAVLDCGSPPPERLVVWLLRWTGLRVSEACALSSKTSISIPGARA